MKTGWTRKIILIAIAIAALVPARALASEPALIEWVYETVWLYTPGAEDWVAAEPGMEAVEGSYVKTGSKGEAVLTWESGHTLKVAKLTTVIVEESKPGRGPVGDSIKLNVDAGRVMALVKKLKGGGTFEVETPVALAAVRGTKFVVEVEEGGESNFFVLDGSIAVGAQGVEIILEQNFKTGVEPGGAPGSPEEIPKGSMDSFKSEAGELKSFFEEVAVPEIEPDAVFEEVVDTVIEERLESQIIFETTPSTTDCCQ